ncbi:MAG TPA: R3H domain-containing nucleic acid-binding protein [bacterium]|nr:R3H domain-containing nucleic acid-binding protein [bacterium]
MPTDQSQPNDTLTTFLKILPRRLQQQLAALSPLDELVEVILDLGRTPIARLAGRESPIGSAEVTKADIASILDKIGEFGGDNRAGIERTLHRISAIRNRRGEVIGLTCRVGRAISGSADIIRDLIESGKSILLLGRPGVGKTTILRETARILADDLQKRVVIVDTSNEIAGDGDIPHPAIGKARRMQVTHPSEQHQVMIEAVENHMPEVIIIDEMGTTLEAEAARTIAERGVQLIATAHGNTLQNLMLNPTLNDLVGGIQSVTLGDEEAKRRGTQKSILERKAPPTFDILIEIQERTKLQIHTDVGTAVDLLLRGGEPPLEQRLRQEDGTYAREHIQGTAAAMLTDEPAEQGTDIPYPPRESRGIYPIGVSRKHITAAAQLLNLDLSIVSRVEDADLILTLKKMYRTRNPKVRAAEAEGIPLFVIKDNVREQVESCLVHLLEARVDPEELAIIDAQNALRRLDEGEAEVALAPRNAFLRHLQHEYLDAFPVTSKSAGEKNRRHLVVKKK